MEMSRIAQIIMFASHSLVSLPNKAFQANEGMNALPMTTAQEQAPISDVGVAIARKQQQQQSLQQQQQSLQLQQQQSLQQQSQSLQQQSERTTGTTTKKKTNANANSNATTKSSTPRSWWSDLLQGSALYLFCLVLPTLLTPLAVLYQQQTWVSGYRSEEHTSELQSRP